MLLGLVFKPFISLQGAIWAQRAVLERSARPVSCVSCCTAVRAGNVTEVHCFTAWRAFSRKHRGRKQHSHPGSGALSLKPARFWPASQQEAVAPR